MAIEERRSATRVALPEPIEATLGAAHARLVEISASGARIEHEERVTVSADATLAFTWRGEKVAIPVKVARSEIAGRRGATLIYQSGIQYREEQSGNAALAALIYWAMTGDDAPARIAEGETAWSKLEPASAPAPAPVAVAPPVIAAPPPPVARPVPVAPPPARSGAGAGTFGSNPFASGVDDDEPRYIRCTLGDDGWRREYVDTPEHPPQGFTVPIEQRADVDGLMRSYEVADPDTRGMIRAALG